MDTRFLGQGDFLVLGGGGTHAALPTLPMQRQGISLADQAAFGQRMAESVVTGQANRGGPQGIDWSQYQSRHAQAMQGQARESALVDARRQAQLSEYAPGLQGPTILEQGRQQYAQQEADKAWLQRLDTQQVEWSRVQQREEEERRRQAFQRRYSGSIDTSEIFGGGG